MLDFFLLQYCVPLLFNLTSKKSPICVNTHCISIGQLFVKCSNLWVLQFRISIFKESLIQEKANQGLEIMELKEKKEELMLKYTNSTKYRMLSYFFHVIQRQENATLTEEDPDIFIILLPPLIKKIFVNFVRFASKPLKWNKEKINIDHKVFGKESPDR